MRVRIGHPHTFCCPFCTLEAQTSKGPECILSRIRYPLLVTITYPPPNEHPCSMVHIHLSVWTLCLVWLLLCLYVEYYFCTVGSITHIQPQQKKHIHFLIKIWKIFPKIKKILFLLHNGIVLVHCVWNVMAHGDTGAEKWRGNNRME